jgi:predicted TIM-barrel enzyme
MEKSMKHSRALALAIKAMEAQIKRNAVNANLLEQYGLVTPTTIEAAKLRKDLQEAIALLQLPAKIKAEHAQLEIEL